MDNDEFYDALTEQENGETTKEKGLTAGQSCRPLINLLKARIKREEKTTLDPRKIYCGQTGNNSTKTRETKLVSIINKPTPQYSDFFIQSKSNVFQKSTTPMVFTKMDETSAETKLIQPFKSQCFIDQSSSVVSVCGNTAATTLANHILKLECVHFVFVELNERHNKPIEICELRKVINYFYPHMIEYLVQTEIPLNNKSSQRRRLSSQPDNRLDEKFMAFYQEFSDLFFVHCMRKEIRLSTLSYDSANERIESLTTGLELGLVATLHQLLKTLRALTEEKAKGLIESKHPYLISTLVKAQKRFSDYITKFGDLFQMEDTDGGILIYLRDSKYRAERQIAFYLKAKFGKGISNYPGIVVEVANKNALVAIVTKDEGSNESGTYAIPMYQESVLVCGNKASDLKKVLHKGDVVTISAVFVESNKNTQKELWRISEVTRITHQSSCPGEFKRKTPKHGDRCICGEDINMLAQRMSSSKFAEWASLHVLCLIDIIRGNGLQFDKKALKRNDVSVQTDISMGVDD